MKGNRLAAVIFYIFLLLAGLLGGAAGLFAQDYLGDFLPAQFFTQTGAASGGDANGQEEFLIIE